MNFTESFVCNRCATRLLRSLGSGSNGQGYLAEIFGVVIARTLAHSDRQMNPRIKRLNEILAPADNHHLRGTHGPLQLTMLGVGAVIGTRIFVLTGGAESRTGNACFLRRGYAEMKLQPVQWPLSGGVLNVPAMFMVILVTWLLVVGTRESAVVNAVLASVKIFALTAFHCLVGADDSSG